MCDKELRDVPARPGQHIPTRPGRFDDAFETKAPSQGCEGQIGYCMSDEEKLEQIFTYRPPTPFTGPKFETLREAARHFAKVILMNVPPGADRTCAIRHVRDAVMTANAGVS